MGARELLAELGKLKLATFSEERVPTARTARPLCACGIGDGIAPLWGMLLRVIAHQIACFASDRAEL